MMKQRHWVALIIVVGLILVIAGTAEAAWYDPAWDYRREITLSSATSVADYQVLVTLTTTIMGSPYANVNADGSDIRFTGSDGTTLQDYWIESWDNNGTSKIWVEVKTSATSTIYMYYGNSGASSASNGADTFVEFLDKDSTSGWTETNITVSTSGDFLRFYNPTAANVGYAVRYDFTSPTVWSLEARLKNESLGTSDQVLLVSLDGNLNNQFSYSISPHKFFQNKCGYNDGTEHEIGTNLWSEGTERIFIHRVDEGNSTSGVDYYVCDTSRTVLGYAEDIGFTFGSPTDMDGIVIADGATDAVCDVYFRWIFLRSFASPEPSASVGEWESQGIPDAATLYNTGGAEQLSFDNVRQNTTTPRFRVSATHTADFNRFQIELNDQADFGGTAYTQTFSGTYSSGTEYNLLCDSLGGGWSPTDGTTYYVRAKASADGGSSWGDWSSSTWSFTYNAASEDPMWFQTTDEQFDTGTLNQTQTYESDQVRLAGSTTLRPVTPDGTNTNVLDEGNGTTDLWDSVDDDPDSPVTTDYVNNTPSTDSNIFFNLTDMPADFDSMDTLQVDFYLNAPAGFFDDNCTLYAQVFQSDESTTLTSEEQLATRATAAGYYSVSFTSVTGSDKTTWDGARLRLRWNYSVFFFPDGGEMYVAAVELDGTYTGTVSTGTITSPAIDFDSVTSAQAWDELSWNDTEPGSSDIKYKVKYRDTNWLSGWDKRIKLTIDSSKVDADLSDFPVLAYLNTSSGITNADVSCVFDELGSDANRKKIAVTKSDVTTECYVEIEKWDHASEKAWLWVKVSGTNSISSSSDTDLYLYYDADQADNTTYVGDSGSRTEVWDDGGSNYFNGVWHLNETSGGTDAFKDSTSNNNHGTNTECTLGATGKVGNAIGFDGINDYIQTLSNESRTASNITWECWFKANTTTGAHHLLWEGKGTENGWGCGLSGCQEMHMNVGAYDANNIVGCFYGTNESAAIPNVVRIDTAFSDTTNWRHAAFVVTNPGSSPSGELFLDGVSQGTDTGDQTGRTDWGTNFRIGRPGANERYYQGTIDEVRISSTVRSSAWIEASYNSGNDSLVTFGSEESEWKYIPDGDLSGNSSGFDDSPVNLSALNTTTYNELKIEATFTEGSSPILDDWTLSWVGPTLVELVSFSAVGHFNKVLVHWKTGSEYNNAGFNLYVSEQEGGPYERLNASLIPGTGTSSTGEAYSYVDYNVTDGSTYYYRLEDVEYSGTKTMHGPVMASPGLDTDQDGMTDDWEIYYGLDPDTDDTQDDPDGDGLTNLEEFLGGEDPTQDNSVSEYGTQPAEPQSDGVRIISSDESGITIELITTGFETIPKEVDGITFQLLEIPGYDHGYTTEPGRPKLPVKSVLLGIPEGASCSIEDLDYDVVDLYGYNIYPVTGTVDTDFYATNSLYPSDIAEVSRVGSIRGQRVAAVNFNPLLFNPATSELRFYKRIRLRLSFEDVEQAPSRPGKPIVLPGDEKLKIYTSKEGLYRIEWDQISDQLLNLGYTDPRTIKVYFKGEEIPIRVEGEADGSFDYDDYIEFYALANDSKYSSTNVYWLTYEGDDGKRMEDILSSDDSPVDTPDRFKCIKHLEKNDFYWGERKGDEGVDRWFWASYIWGGEQQDYEIDLKDLNPSHVEDEARVKISCYGLFDVGHHTLTYINGELIDDALWDGEGEHIVDVMVPQNCLFDGQNTITIEAKLDTGEDYDLILPNYFEIAYYRNFTADEDLLDFSHSSDDGVSQFDMSGFSNEDLELFDITEPDAVKYITGFEITEESGVYSMSFKDLLIADEGKRYLTLAHNKANSPDVLKLDTPSNLRSETNTSDYVIITHSDFKESLMPLRNLYEDKLISEERYMRVKLIDIEDIYDEFNYGIKSPHAIKDFLTYAYTEWSPPHPTYVLLVGDATYDYKDYLGYGNTDYVPTYLLPDTPYFGETASDNWFVCLDGEDDILPDMFIGRIPASTAQEVTDVVGKIIEYNAIPSTDWSKEILLLADDEQPFEDTCDSLTAYVPEELGVSKHYLGDYSNYSLFTGDIIEGIDDGALIVNYMGHGSTDLWTEEALFNTNTIDALNNQGRYPFVTTFTCIDGYYLHPYEYSSMAEVFLMRPQAGAIACWSPTGMGMPQGHNILSQELFKAMFLDGKRGLGAATTQAKLELFSKSATSHEDLIHTYILFGDPALSLNMGAEDSLPEGFESIYESTILNYGQPWDWDDSNQGADVDGGWSDRSGSGRCFIATAVFGTNGHPHVKALRDVRDRYLITNVPGRWLVSVYYSYGRSWADFLNAHSWCKPVVRLALLPLVGISYLLVKTSLLAKLLTGLLLLGFVVCCLLRIHGRSINLTP